MPSICVIGLGYVGLPLAVGLARHNQVIGYDISEARVRELSRGVDRTNEVRSSELTSSALKFTTSVDALKGCEVFIIAVPTPVDDAKRPDLSALTAASQTIARVIAPGALVILESTVYPGVTETIVGGEIERSSGLRSGKDFFLGYSPERMNPGDAEHTVETIVKVVAGQTPSVTGRMAKIYGEINGGKIFQARDIRTAEAAKVIENAQRDINIAFVNEVTVIFNRIGLSIYDVLEAARTKWNFLPFQPGLVGGHCIGVDPFYLADLAQRINHWPEVILAGRRINDNMGQYIADSVARALVKKGRGAGSRTLILGLTFKENVPDLRNSKVVDIANALSGWGHQVSIFDPLADAVEASREFGLSLLPELPLGTRHDCVIGAVAHREFVQIGGDALAALVAPDGVIADIKGIWRSLELPSSVTRWTL
jgi:UDP-N-acetyl-D-galactosamine dehydrogenase